MSYKRFFAMIATSMVVMFILMYSTAYAFTHVWWSQTRFWMALYMGAAMAVIMLSFMLSMYSDKKKNVAIFAGSLVLFVAALFFARSQTTIGDTAWMKAMIPHHSIAILTSERAEISDPRVRRLADEIILSQRREIAEMEALIRDLDGLDDDSEPMPPDVPPVEGGSVEKTGPVPGAPSLKVAQPALRGEIVMIAETKVESDAWVVLHPAAPGGGPDASAVIGVSFIQHGKTENVPVRLTAAVEPGTPLFAMLHDDTGKVGVFEYAAGNSLDQPLSGGSVAQRFEAR